MPEIHSHGTPCRICGRETRELRDEPFSLRYHRCPRCDFVFVEQRGVPSAAEEEQEYLRHDNRPGNAGYVRFLKTFLDQGVRPFLGPARSALDFGCGPGPVLAGLLREEGLAVDVYDPFFFPDESWRARRYDLITATEVFEHIREPRQAFSALCDRLEDNGVLSIMTRFHPEKDAGFLSWWYRREASHISFYCPRTFSFLAGRAGVELAWTDGRSICVMRNRLPGRSGARHDARARG